MRVAFWNDRYDTCKSTTISRTTLLKKLKDPDLTNLVFVPKVAVYGYDVPVFDPPHYAEVPHGRIHRWYEKDGATTHGLTRETRHGLYHTRLPLMD